MKGIIMKRLSIKDVNVLLKIHNNYCIRVNEFTRQIYIVRFDLGCLDEIIGYLTFNQFIKLDLTIGLVELPINSFMFDYYTIRKLY